MKVHRNHLTLNVPKVTLNVKTIIAFHLLNQPKKSLYFITNFDFL